jgi:hypothetical protein
MVTQFRDNAYARRISVARRINYDEERVRGSLGQLTPKELAESRHLSSGLTLGAAVSLRDQGHMRQASLTHRVSAGGRSTLCRL